MQDGISRETLSEIVEGLSDPPEYFLPAASLSGTRHYMPGHGHREGLNRNTSLILDSSVRLGKEEKLYIYWKNAELSAEAATALKRLLSGIAYFGRAESWVTANLEDNPPREINCSHEVLPDSAQVTTACTLSVQEFRLWQQLYSTGIEGMALARQQQKAFKNHKDISAVKLTKTVKNNAAKEIPSTLLEALEVSTADLRESGWNSAPGLRFVNYYRPKTAFESKPQVLRSIHSRVTAVRFAVSSAVLPRLTDAVSVGERMRIAVMSIAGRQNDGSVPWVFSGKSHDGTPLQSNHNHSYYLGESCRGNGRISHITVFSKHGYDRSSLKALLSLRKVWGRDGYDLQLIPAETGTPSELGGIDVKRGKSPLMAQSAYWESATPFYPVRHPGIGASQRKNPQIRYALMKEYYRSEVIRELKNAGFPEPETVEIADTRGIVIDGHFTSCLKFNSRRNGSGRKAAVPPVVVRIRFSSPVHGPVSIGFSSHYGLGSFRPVSAGGV
jgi:CRISPR-associated protein Csb2